MITKPQKCKFVLRSSISDDEVRQMKFTKQDKLWNHTITCGSQDTLDKIHKNNYIFNDKEEI